MDTMTEKIAHLRALLLDDGWDVERRADALKTLAEIEAAWDALLAPLAPAPAEAEVQDAVRPLVEDRARLAREVERLRGIVRAANGLAGKARAEIARLTSDLDSLAQDVGQALCAATLRPGETITDQRPHAIVSLVVDLVGEKHAMAAEIARLTAAPGEAWERLRERAKTAVKALEGDVPIRAIDACYKLADALAAVEPRGVDTIAADPSDIADRLIEAVEDDNGNTYPATVRQRRALVAGVRRMLAAGCQFTDAAVAAIAADEAEESADRFGLFDGFAEVDAALNAIFDGNHGPARTRAVDTITADPSAPVDPAEQAYQPTVEVDAAEAEIRRIYRAHPLDTWIPILARRMVAPVIDVTAITHDFRPGAQDGMPRLADVEAREMAVTTGEDAPARQCVAVLATNDAGEVLLVRTKRGWERG